MAGKHGGGVDKQQGPDREHRPESSVLEAAATGGAGHGGNYGTGLSLKVQYLAPRNKLYWRPLIHQNPSASVSTIRQGPR